VTTIRRMLVPLAAAATLALGAAGTAGAAMTRPGNIVQTAAAAGQFKTLIKLAQAAGLAGVLEGKGPYTVFAPTDAAFARLPKATVSSLEHHRAALRNVLLYHVLQGRVTASQLVKLPFVRTLEGQSLPVRVKNGTVTVGGVKVIKANVAASNGVIHVIDGVLIPR
jgi:uncharacterized surface protein with fasciclin (FAS1) repeats